MLTKNFMHTVYAHTFIQNFYRYPLVKYKYTTMYLKYIYFMQSMLQMHLSTFMYLIKYPVIGILN